SGTYTTTLTGAAAGTTDSLTATVAGVTLSGKPRVWVVPGAVDAANSSVSLANSTLASGSSDQAILVVRDGVGNAISGLWGSAFRFTFSGGTSTVRIVSFAATGTAGTYKLTFSGVLAGTVSTLTATVNGVVLADQPAVAVTPGTVSAAR